MERQQDRQDVWGAGVKRRPLAGLLLLALMTLVLAALPATAEAATVYVAKPSAQLTAVDPAEADQFGTAVALSGDTCLIGAWNKTVGDLQQVGAAYVFTGSGASWSQQAKLLASDGTAWDGFGQAVALDADTAFVGAPHKTVNDASEAGAVYVFKRTDTTWAQIALITAADAASGDHFGASIAVSGSTLIVGAPDRSGGGAAFVLVNEGGAWIQQADFNAGETSRNEFGFSVALAGDAALVGAPSANKAFLYQRSGTEWTGTTLTAPAGAGGFGEATALDGDTALVAAPWGTYDNDHEGHVYVYARDSGIWVRQGVLSPYQSGSQDLFGQAVALSGDVALVARTSMSDVFVFARSAGVWTLQSAGLSGPPPTSDKYGSAMALSDTSAVIGAPDTSFAEIFRPGAAYACSLMGDSTPPMTTTSFAREPNAAGWFALPFEITLTAADSVAGVKDTFYRPLGETRWSTYGAPFSVIKQGVSTYEFYSDDWAGFAEAIQHVTVKLDSVPPTTAAMGDYYPTRWHYQKLWCRLVDPARSPCKVKLQILKSGRVVLTKLVGQRTPGTIVYRWRATLPRGRYTYRFTAVDVTGHRQSKAVARRLVVR